MSELIAPRKPTAVTTPVDMTLSNQAPWKKWAGLGVLTLGLAIVVIDTTLLNVSLSTIIKDLKTDLQSLQWVITAYALVLAAFTITGGRFGDLFGRKKMFMLGAIIFAVGSFIASISHNVPVLLLGEAIIEGFGAALMMPATASLVVANFSGKDRATAFGIWGGVAGASSAIGPLLGGYLTSHYSWRWGFRINVFVAAVVIIGSLLFLKESLDERKPKLDWWGVLLSSLGLLGVVFGIIESSTLGWWHAKKAFEFFGHTINFGSLSLVPLSIAFGVIILALFAWWEMRLEKQGKSPLVSMKLLRNRQFTSGAVTTAILTLGMTGMVFALPVFLQTVKNLDAFHTGLALLPLSLALLVVAPISGRLGKKITPKHLIQAGLLIDVVAAFIIRATIKVDVPVSHLIPGLALYGLGMGMVFPPISNLVLSAVPVQMSGEASGVNNTLRQVGATLGAAIIGAAILASLSTHLVAGVQASPIIPENAKAQIIQTVSNPESNVEFSVNSAVPNGTPPIIGQEIRQLVSEASTQATKDAYVYSALFAFLCFITALFLPKTDAHQEQGEAQNQTEEHSGRKFATAGVLLVLGVVGAFWLLHQSSKTVIATGITDAEAIRSVFVPPQATSTPAQIISNPNVSMGIPTIDPEAASVPVQVRGPENPAPAQVLGASTNPAPQIPPPPPAPVFQIYQNPALGFKMQISSGWQATETGDEQSVAFVNSSGQTVSVQSFQNPNVDINTVQEQLSGSPSVSNITPTTFLGEPAIEFKTPNGWGRAVIHNSRLFYIMAPSLRHVPANSFTFL